MCRSTESGSPPPFAAAMPSHQSDNKIVKPRLPRKLAASARINLNRYWHALEELMPVSRRPFDEADANAINENIDNERRLAEMRLADADAERHGDISTSFKAASPIDFAQSSSFPRTSGFSVNPMTPDENTPPSYSPGASR